MSSLPSFRQPPVTEVAASIQFDEISGLTGPMMGLLWQRFRELFPTMQVQGVLLDQVSESFDVPDRPVPRFDVQIVTNPPAPRLWFVSEDESDLIQVQQDRFVFNWRRRADVYPRYSHVRASFERHFAVFLDFLKDEGLADIIVNQWEISYVNIITTNDVWQSHADIGAILPSWKHIQSDHFLPLPEDVMLKMRYRIEQDGEPIGRLHVSALPRFSLPEKKPIVLLTLTARGTPYGVSEPTGVFRLLDLGHDWIVRGFTAITSREMHTYWGREQ